MCDWLRSVPSKALLVFILMAVFPQQACLADSSVPRDSLEHAYSWMWLKLHLLSPASVDPGNLKANPATVEECQRNLELIETYLPLYEKKLSQNKRNISGILNAGEMTDSKDVEILETFVTEKQALIKDMFVLKKIRNSSQRKKEELEQIAAGGGGGGSGGGNGGY